MSSSVPFFGAPGRAHCYFHYRGVHTAACTNRLSARDFFTFSRGRGMKRLMTACALWCVMVFGAWGQDGLFGSFILGEKMINMDALNGSLVQNGIQGVTIPSHQLSLGGEGHVVIANHFVVGGKGFAFSWEKAVSGTLPERCIKITGGMGIGSVGYSINLTDNARTAFRIFPQLGLGVSTFLLQSERTMDSANSNFDSIIVNENDYMTAIEKVGLVIDLAVSADWYLKFIHLLSIIPGLETGPMLHFEAGYTITPANLHWMRDVDQLYIDPDVKFNGFYVHFGIGLGFSTGK